MKLENECNVNDWYETSRAIADSFNKHIAIPEIDKEFEMATPTRFTLQMQLLISDYVVHKRQIEMLEKYIEELNICVQ